jgi:hypothetical protein
MEHGKNFKGYHQGHQLWELRDIVLDKIANAKEAYAEAHPKKETNRKVWKAGMNKAANEVKIHVSYSIDEVNTKVQGYYDALTLSTKKFINKVPTGSESHYDSKDIRNWMFRALRQIMLVAEHYAKEHADADTYSKDFMETANKSEAKHTIIKKLHDHLKKLKKQPTAAPMPGGGHGGVHMVPAMFVDGHGRPVSYAPAQSGHHPHHQRQKGPRKANRGAQPPARRE